MNVEAIQKLVEAKYPIDILDEAEMALLNEEEPLIKIDGENDGDQITTLIAAKWIIEEMQSSECDFNTALKKYEKQ